RTSIPFPYTTLFRSVNCECGKRLQGRDEDAGRATRCPFCQRIVTLPSALIAEPLPPEPPLTLPASVPVTEYTCRVCRGSFRGSEDRKSTRLNSSHQI